ncbi:MAG: DUF2085 domain-containing protein [Calditrichaeota bacterium]|nr:DUF2085 domain-containing protein [Calditrichota bacterium]
MKNNPLLKALLIILIGLNFLNLAAPVLAASSWRIFQYFGAGIYFLFDPLCHQIPQRSIFINQIPMALCVRCTFLYFGGLVGIIVLLFKRDINIPSAVLVTLAIFVVAEISSEKIGLYTNWAVLRGVSGFLSGLILTLFLAQTKFSGQESKTNKRVITNDF